MLETLTRELRPGVTVTVREPSNADYYAARKLYQRLEDNADDADMENHKANLVVIVTRTVSAEGVALPALTSAATDAEITAALDAYMALPQKLTEAWVTAAAEVGSAKN